MVFYCCVTGYHNPCSLRWQIYYDPVSLGQSSGYRLAGFSTQSHEAEVRCQLGRWFYLKPTGCWQNKFPEVVGLGHHFLASCQSGTLLACGSWFRSFSCGPFFLGTHLSRVPSRQKHISLMLSFFFLPSSLFWGQIHPGKTPFWSIHSQLIRNVITSLISHHIHSSAPHTWRNYLVCSLGGRSLEHHLTILPITTIFEYWLPFECENRSWRTRFQEEVEEAFFRSLYE